MKKVSAGPDVGQGSDEHTRATVIPGKGPPPRLDFADRAEVRVWLDDLAVHVDDLAAAAEDQVAPMDERTLGPAKAREIIGDARNALVQSIAIARAGLASGDEP